MGINIDERYKQIGCRIAYFRKLCNLTQIELADKIGMSSGYLSKIECGNYQKSISLSMLMNIADGLGVDVEELFVNGKTGK